MKARLAAMEAAALGGGGGDEVSFDGAGSRGA
jgi:hypothetical protein